MTITLDCPTCAKLIDVNIFADQDLETKEWYYSLEKVKPRCKHKLNESKVFFRALDIIEDMKINSQYYNPGLD